MADSADIEYGVSNALEAQLPDLTPLFRAAYVFELQEVERRLDALGRTREITEIRDPDGAAKDQKVVMDALWRRRSEILGLLWPSASPADSCGKTDREVPEEEC